MKKPKFPLDGRFHISYNGRILKERKVQMNINRKAIFENLFAMDTIVHSLSDEDLIENWLANHVPDGCDTLQDIEDNYSYMTDEELAEEYENTAKCFAKLVKIATSDGYAKWTSPVCGGQPQTRTETVATEPKFKVGQQVCLRQTKYWNVGKNTFKIDPDVKFIVLEVRENIFDSKKSVYDIRNETIGTITVDEHDIAEAK